MDRWRAHYDDRLQHVRRAKSSFILTLALSPSLSLFLSLFPCRLFLKYECYSVSLAHCHFLDSAAFIHRRTSTQSCFFFPLFFLSPKQRLPKVSSVARNLVYDVTRWTMMLFQSPRTKSWTKTDKKGLDFEMFPNQIAASIIFHRASFSPSSATSTQFFRHFRQSLQQSRDHHHQRHAANNDIINFGEIIERKKKK